MIRHTQTIFGNGDAGAVPGNCMQTAVASLLDLPMEEVPHFVAVPGHQWWTEFLNWVVGRGFQLQMYADRFSPDSYMDGWVTIAPLSEAPTDRLVLASGMAERGFDHMVILQGGQLVHDPHPSGVGLLEDPEEVWVLEPWTGESA